MRPKFKLPKYLIVSLMFYTLAACNSNPYVTVKTDYDHAAAFGKYHTYAIDMGSTSRTHHGRSFAIVVAFQPSSPGA